MRLVAKSIITNSKILSYRYARRLFCSRTLQPHFDLEKLGTNLIEVEDTWKCDVEPELRAGVLRDMQVIPAFITEDEEQGLLEELEPRLKKLRYEFDHWDDAIHGFKETEKSEWLPHNRVIIDRVKETAFTEEGDVPMPYVHILDLAPTGHIKPHIDAVKHCGPIIAGICLLSGAVMRLSRPRAPELSVVACLPRRALYVMRGVARYDFTHAVPAPTDCLFAGQVVKRTRRVSVICRSKPVKDTDSTGS